MTKNSLDPVRLKSLRKLAKEIGHDFADYGLLDRALSHSSLSNEGLPNYERLEFLGDAVLGFLVAENLYRREPEIPEGELTERRARLVSRKPLAQVCEILGLTRYLRVGRGLTQDALNSPRIQADLVEAIIGAIYLDRGEDAARRFVKKFLLDHFGPVMDAVRPVIDAKTRLNRFVQAHSLPAPTYQVIETSGPHHQLQFRVSVTVGEVDATSSTVRSKQEGEQEAAEQALQELQQQRLEEEEGPVFFPEQENS